MFGVELHLIELVVPAVAFGVINAAGSRPFSTVLVRLVGGASVIVAQVGYDPFAS